MSAFPRRTAEPSVEPLTLAEALVQMKETSDSGGEIDTLALRLIRTARRACEERIERTLIATPWRLTLDAFPDAIELRQPPILAVQSVQFMDADGNLQTLDPLDYRLDKVSEPGYLVPARGKAWPAVLDEINAVTIDYTAGYGEGADKVPEPLRHWIAVAVTHLYQERAADLPQGFGDGLLAPFKMLGL